MFSKKVKTWSGVLKHICGLNIPEGFTCQISVGDDGVHIENGDSEFIMSLSGVNSVQYEISTDIEKYYKASLAKGLLGAAVFGIPGAVVGSMPNEKEKRLVSCCAVISYTQANGENLSIVLTDTQPNTLVCANFVDALKKRMKTCEKTVTRL